MKKVKGVNKSSKTAKYFKAHRLEGKTKTQACKEAGISSVTNVSNIENTQTYQRLDMAYKDILSDHIGMDEVASRHAELIRQDKDNSVSLRAIELHLKKVEKEDVLDDEENKMIVVLRA
jgi:hypothetical protein